MRHTPGGIRHRLFRMDERRRTLIALRQDRSCSECGDEPVRYSYRQLAMFRHGGHGADTERTLEVCSCRVRVIETIERNPTKV